MSHMTGRERLLRAFNKQETDRIAISPFIHSNFIKEFHKNPDVDLTEGVVDVYKFFGFDIMHRQANICFGESHLNSRDWRVNVSEKRNGTTTLVTTTIETPEKIMTSVDRYEELSTYLKVRATQEWFIKSPDDFDQFVKYQPSVPPIDLTDIRKAKSLTGDDGIVAPWFQGGVFNYLAEFRKLDDILVDAMVDTEFYDQMMCFFKKRLIEGIKPVLDDGIDVLSYGGNIANGSVAGPDFFKNHVLKYEKELIDYIQNTGTHVLYHNCGDGKNMIDLYNTLGIHAFESMTEPPFADMNLLDSVTRFDKGITLIGNLDQIIFLRQATPSAIRDKVIEKLKIIGDRKGFIMGTTDFFEEDTPYENIFAFANAVKGDIK